jgi:short-subunit dehydrogenase
MIKNDTKELYTLITGGSKGIGNALAVECAKKGWNLILISLPGEKLKEISTFLMKTYTINVRYLELDLIKKGAPLKVFNWCSRNKLQVNRLINNAGMGYTGLFEQYSKSYFEKIIGLNMTTVVLLILLFLPELRKHNPAFILNVGSMCSMLPVPYKAIYAASKSFVYSFSIALKEELRKTSVRVGVLCPGPVPTNEDVQKRIDSARIFARFALLDSKRVAQTALKGIERGKSVIIPGFINKIYFLIFFIIPQSLRPRIMAWFLKKNHSKTT